MLNKQINCLFYLECGPVKWRCPIETECWVIAPLNVLFLSEVWSEWWDCRPQCFLVSLLYWPVDR